MKPNKLFLIMLSIAMLSAMTALFSCNNEERNAYPNLAHKGGEKFISQNLGKDTIYWGDETHNDVSIWTVNVVKKGEMEYAFVQVRTETGETKVAGTDGTVYGTLEYKEGKLYKADMIWCTLVRLADKQGHLTNGYEIEVREKPERDYDIAFVVIGYSKNKSRPQQTSIRLK
ncbi:MAG: hypothetical protein ACTTK2_06985 [Hoylesella marshii]|uniref:hypothetical protein n=1 Tax=Hoylesella marshii TaxID=189722 RepID=UPI003F9EEEAA